MKNIILFRPHAYKYNIGNTGIYVYTPYSAHLKMCKIHKYAFFLDLFQIPAVYKIIHQAMWEIDVNI